MQSARFGFAASIASRFSIAILTLGFSGTAILPPAVAQTPTNRTGELGSPNLQSPPVSPFEENEPPRLPRSPRSSPPATDQFAEADRLLEQGYQQYQQNRYQAALELLQQSLALYQNPNLRRTNPQRSRSGEAYAMLNLGIVYGGLSQFEREIAYYQQILPILRELGDRSGEAKVLNNLGAVYGSLGRYQQAIDYYQQALPVYREVGDRDSEGLLLANIGRLYVVQNSPISAIEQLQKSVAVRESIRVQLRALPQADQQAYTNSIAGDYRLLAELLQRQNRDREAQAVLDLL